MQYYVLKTSFSGHNKTWGTQKNLGILSLNALMTAGLT